MNKHQFETENKVKRLKTTLAIHNFLINGPKNNVTKMSKSRAFTPGWILMKPCQLKFLNAVDSSNNNLFLFINLFKRRITATRTSGRVSLTAQKFFVRNLLRHRLTDKCKAHQECCWEIIGSNFSGKTIVPANLKNCLNQYL